MQKNDRMGVLVCHHCNAENPLKAYCCLSCFKVLRPKQDVPFWKIYIRPSSSALVLVVLVAGLGIYTLKKWMDNLEAQVSMNFKSADYNLTFVADKKRKKKLFGSVDLKGASDQEEEQSSDTPSSEKAVEPSQDR